MIISKDICVPWSELKWLAIHSSGPGGQNINKVATAIQLQFDITNSSLPDFLKQKLLSFRDSRLSKQGVLTIKSQLYRVQTKNREDAFLRLQMFLKKGLVTPKKRVATKPTFASKTRKLESKTKNSIIKQTRKKITYID